MATLATKTSEHAAEVTLSLIEELLGSSPIRDIAVRMWDGTTWKSHPTASVRCTLVLRHPGALRKMFMPPNELTLGEAYLYDDFDIEGDITAVIPLIKHFIGERRGVLDQFRFGTRLLTLPKMDRPRGSHVYPKMQGALHSKERDRQATNHHYDRPRDFFALWLGSRMVYSCGYFASPDDDLDTAQERKLEHICRKLRLRPGERLLDIGCGWAALAIYAAQRYGVHADGILLSSVQAESARERIKMAGLESRCRIDICDYRDADRPEAYDKIAALEIAEHLGKASLPGYYKSAWQMLRPGGIFLNQSGTHSTASLILGRDFVRRYVFPDGEPTIPISDMLQAAESAGFQVRDVENLKEHYVYTVRHWLRRLQERSEDIKKVTDEVTYRAHRIYLAAAIHEFEVQTAHVYQAVLVKSDTGSTGLPLTRDGWYARAFMPDDAVGSSGGKLR
jgi:cyclopropane-fatty-acyl-phospholipid synthase